MKINISGKLLLLFPAVFFMIIFATHPARGEFIFLKNGEIAEGTIVSDSAKSVKLRKADNTIIVVERDNILRILYSKLKIGKLYIQKRDGEGIVAFIVDEDQDGYTFRKDLYKPEEFVLSRSDVLFMAEKNPSGLKVKGEIGTDRVSLVWLPPMTRLRGTMSISSRKRKLNMNLWKL